jgi:tRNA(adenine34) deaminase
MKFSDFDKHCMQQALKMARKACEQGEVPIGAVLAKDGQIIARGWNCPITSNDPTSHAEIVVLRQAAQKINNYRLVDTTLYVTLEPCMMCIGAMTHARIKRCVFGAFDPKDKGQTGQRLVIEGGLLVDECGQLLRDFFAERR